MRILVIEDDALIAETLSELLAEHYEVETVTTGRAGLDQGLTGVYDLIVLDLGLPDMSGHEVCRALRGEGIATPVIILTGQGDVRHKVAALDSGADDYLVKPFKFPELAARIRAVLRRSPGPVAPLTMEFGDIILDPENRIATRKGKAVKLRRKEFDLLAYLLRNQGQIVTRSMILDNVWEDGAAQFSNIVDVHVKYLRDRIEKPFKAPLIKTVHGVGYTIAI